MEELVRGFGLVEGRQVCSAGSQDQPSQHFFNDFTNSLKFFKILNTEKSKFF